MQQRWVALGLLALCTALRAALPPAEDFVRPAAIENVVMSPSGQRLAMVVATKQGHNALAVMDLPPGPGGARVVAQYADSDVQRVQWVNDNRLVYFLAEPGYQVRPMGAGLLAVDHDGKNERSLIAWRNTVGEVTTAKESRVLNGDWRLLRTLDDGSDDVIVVQSQFDNIGDRTGSVLGRLNTRSGLLTRLSTGAPSAGDDWVFDSRGELRAMLNWEGRRIRLLVRTPGAEGFSVVDERDRITDPSLEPEWLQDDKHLVVRTGGGRGTLGLFVYDLQKRELLPEPLVQVARFDIGSTVSADASGRIAGVRLVADRPTTVWLDEGLQRLQAAVDGALPGRFNRLVCGRCGSSPFYAIVSTGDNQPGEFYLFDVAKRALSKLGAARPWLDPATQGRRSFHWTQARDGLPLPVVVTHPPGSSDKQALPAVVVVHGGPWLRGGSRAWNAEEQFLASRGWRVIAPEFRGSWGFGGRHYWAGRRQWGLAMQDDLVDALDWAAREGLVDKNKVCIYGGSYGGYAALMAPATHPDRFRCAASFAGVTDIRQMFDSVVGDWSQESRTHDLVEWIGDPKKDAEALRRVSPVERVAEIKVPVLLAQGSLDRRVPQEQATRFERAARAAGVPIERVTYAEAGHGFTESKDHADFLRRLEAFLARSLTP